MSSELEKKCLELESDLLEVRRYAEARGIKALAKVTYRHLPTNLSETLDHLVPQRKEIAPGVHEIQCLIHHAEAQGNGEVPTPKLRQAIGYYD